MFPYSFSPYGSPSYGASDTEYLRALAEEQAARQAYTDALRAQADARARAARARRQRQVYEHPHSAYLSDEDEDDGYGYGYYPRARPSYAVPPQNAFFEEQRRRELEQRRRQEALELERERIRQLEEQQHRRMLEEERRRRMLLEEELRRQKEAEERDQETRRRLQEEYRRRQPLSPLEQLLGLRPSRSMQPELPHTQRARTTSPPSVRRAPSAQPSPAHGPAVRTSSPQRTPSPSKRAHSPSTSPAPAAQTPPPQATTPPPTTEQIAAATKIQETWRTHSQRQTALSSIARIAATFEASKTAFTLPATLDYQRAGGDISQYITVPTTGVVVPAPVTEAEMDEAERAQVPKLAYTPTNAPVHVYEEELNRMLMQLDEVQSGGDAEVRGGRRELARRIEREAERVERVKVAVWKAWQAQQAHETTATAETEMAVEHESQTAVPAPEVESVAASEAQMDIDETPAAAAVPAAEESVAPSSVISEDETPKPAVTMSESTLPPPLVDARSEAGDSEAPLHTPQLTHTRLESEQVQANTQDIPMKDTEPEPQTKQPRTTTDLVSSLYPLFGQDWDDVESWDYF